MDLTLFNDMDFGNEELFREFLDLNAMAHETYFTILLSQGVVLAHLPLFTEDGQDPDWLLIHASDHRALSSVLGVGTVDLEDVDFSDEDEFYAWVSDHNAAHAQINTALGL